jgi:hypothetical protein
MEHWAILAGIPSVERLSISLTRRFLVSSRLEAFNVLNHPNLNNPTTSFASSTFGQISGAGDPRIFQASVKLKF